jgi:hypothetical protein
VLARLAARDQADRSGWNPHIARRDARRLERTKTLVARGRVCTPEEHTDAALILLHSLLPADHLAAHVLSTWAASHGGAAARWLSAAAYDRWLVSRGLPQWYGTQMRQVGGRTCLIRLDGEATDEDRAARDVPPLAELVGKVAGYAGITLPSPDLASLDGAGLYCPAEAWVSPSPSR